MRPLTQGVMSEKMTKNKLITIFSMVFIVALGVWSIYSSISILYDPESVGKGYILDNKTNFLIKYSPSIVLGYLGIVFSIYPFLYFKNIFSLGENFQEANEFVKAKMKLAVNILVSPAMIFLILSIFYSEKITNKTLLLLLVVGGLLYAFGNNLYICFFKKNNIT